MEWRRSRDIKEDNTRKYIEEEEGKIEYERKKNRKGLRGSYGRMRTRTG